MAPRVKWYSNGKMDSVEFSLYRQYCQSLEIARYDDEEQCWYVPMADMERLVETLKDEGIVSQEPAKPNI